MYLRWQYLRLVSWTISSCAFGHFHYHFIELNRKFFRSLYRRGTEVDVFNNVIKRIFASQKMGRSAVAAVDESLAIQSSLVLLDRWTNSRPLVILANGVEIARVDDGPHHRSELGVGTGARLGTADDVDEPLVVVGLHLKRGRGLAVEEHEHQIGGEVENARRPPHAVRLRPVVTSRRRHRVIVKAEPGQQFGRRSVMGAIETPISFSVGAAGDGTVGRKTTQ